MTFDRGGIEEIHRLLSSLPRWPTDATEAQRLELVQEEAVLRDQLVRLYYAFDARDLETFLSYFAEDCVMTNPRMQAVGMAQLRAEYEYVLRTWSKLRHLWTNVAVQFPHRVDEAYRTAYYHTTLVNDEQSVASVGTDIHRLSKRNGEWKIVERRVSYGVKYPITADGSPISAAGSALKR